MREGNDQPCNGLLVADGFDHRPEGDAVFFAFLYSFNSSSILGCRVGFPGGRIHGFCNLGKIEEGCRKSNYNKHHEAGIASCFVIEELADKGNGCNGNKAEEYFSDGIDLAACAGKAGTLRRVGGKGDHQTGISRKSKVIKEGIQNANDKYQRELDAFRKITPIDKGENLEYSR